MDHEHFRIMVLYKKKKAAQKALQEANDDIKGLEACVDTLQKLCTKAGYPHAMVQEKIQRALQGNITLTELVESTLVVGAVTVLDSESPALIRRALLEDRVKQSPVIESRSRSVTWAGTEFPQDWPRQAPSLSPILKPTMKALGSPVIQKSRKSEIDRNGIVSRFTKTSAVFTTINLDNNNPSRKDATEVTSSDTKASDLVNDYSEVTFF
ncbi:hypothetical protein DPMN_000950 [Dreissena polymorpha]|uniref:Uncharacterized protein n=1 Tax=Dreissena polymorpha TaxID=45954 RepID=A0A9D4RQE9_DREPO|nr:hypothetical protein DPMN_000950 [Dreissena polymorpha]